MAHRLSFHNGKAEMAYTGETPWHSLGTRVDALQRPQDMLAHAGLLWTVSTRELRLVDGAPVPGFAAIARDDSNVVLGVATDRYAPQLTIGQQDGKPEEGDYDGCSRSYD